MGHPSCLLDPVAVIVADTSAVINLNATGCAGKILRALPNRILIAEAVMFELEQGRRRGRENADLTQKLISDEVIGVAALGPVGQRHFEELAIGRAVDTLDDGEAASIAYALEAGGVALIDERKAQRICAERFPVLGTASSVDLFAHPKIEEQLGRHDLAAAVLRALEIARMSVPLHRVDWVVGLIGRERASKCKSLPRAAR
jgi:predicted nucleic acid-binding protein